LHNVGHIRRQGFETQMLLYFQMLNQRTKAESLHFCPFFANTMLAVRASPFLEVQSLIQEND